MGFKKVIQVQVFVGYHRGKSRTWDYEMSSDPGPQNVFSVVDKT